VTEIPCGISWYTLLGTLWKELCLLSENYKFLHWCKFCNKFLLLMHFILHWMTAAIISNYVPAKEVPFRV
jgi:hypothetical protein